MIRLLTGLTRAQMAAGAVVIALAGVGAWGMYQRHQGAQGERERQNEITEEREDAIEDAMSGECHFIDRLRGSCE